MKVENRRDCEKSKSMEDKTMKYGLVGRNLEHSFSKIIHERLGGYIYDLINIAGEGDFIDFINERSFNAINITIPYKEKVIPCLDSMDGRAAAIGAVNTVINDNGKLTGYNTDYDGFAYTLDANGIDVEGKKVLLLGCGGASRAVQAVLKDRDAGSVIITGTAEKGGIITNETAARLHSNADIIINTTPVGLYPSIDEAPVSVGDFPNCKVIVDVIYNPLKTTLMIEAEQAGIRTVGGLEMLVMQAVKAYELFTGNAVKEQTARETVNFLRNSKMNIALIGMPSSGKSTIGRLLEGKTGRKFVDTDDLVIAFEGRSVREMWDAEGEPYFRRLEHMMVQQVSLLDGHIIATGGGVIKNKRNIDFLRHNCKIIFLDRPLEDITSCDVARPLNSSAEAVTKMYHERYGLYREYADIYIDNSGSIESTVDEILSKIR